MSSLVKTATLTSLQGYTPTTDTVYCQGRTATGDGYEGVFEWFGGNQSAGVASDTQHGVWVPPSSDTTGASGAWKRVFDGPDIQAVWFGLGTTNDATAINGCVAVAVSLGKAIVLPAGTFTVSQLTLTGAKAIRGQGVGLTTIKLKTGTYTAGTAFLQLGAGCVFEDVSISCNDSSFDACNPLYATGANVKIRNIEVNGRFKNGVYVDSSINAELDNIHVTSTNVASFRGIQIVGATGGSLSNCIVDGLYANHLVSVDTSTAFASSFIRSIGQSGSGTGFGVSLTSSTGCTVAQSSGKDTGKEAFQMTQCTDCSVSYCYAEWSTLGNDFGSSIDSCVRCEISHSHFNNAYKAAVAIASDHAASRDCVVAFNQAHNCAVRATTAGLSSIEKSVFVQYSNASYASDNNEFANNTSDLDASLTVGSFHVEGIGGTGTITNSRVRSNHVTGAGTYTAQYVLQPKTKLWRDDFIAWAPSPVPTTVGTTAPTFAVNAANTKILVDGDEAEAYLDFTVSSLGTGNSGQLLVPLPVDYPGATDFAGIAYGADIGSTDLAVRGIVNGGNLFLTLFNPALTAANGAFNLYPVINTSQRFVVTFRYRLAH